MLDETILDSVARLHDVFERTVADCHEQILTKSELQRTISDARDELKNMLEPGSRAFRVFERLSHEAGTYWINNSGTIYAPRNECIYAQKWLDMTLAVLRELDPRAEETRRMSQYALPAGEIYANVRKVLRVMKVAQSELAVIDPYLDSEVFNYLDEIAPDVAIRLLTGVPPKPMFTKLLTELRSQRSNVAARASSQFHDRFLIIDTADLWQLGCSLNGIGKATSMMSRVTETSEKTSIFSEFEAAWQSGAVP